MRVRIRRLVVGTMLSLSTTAALAGAGSSPAFAAPTAPASADGSVSADSAAASTLPAGTGPTGSMTRSEFIAASVLPAQRSQREYGVPASVTIAQAIIESGWGRSGLSANDNNFFGMKCFNRGPVAVGCRTYATSECEPDGSCYRTAASFRVYATSADSFRDHGRLLATSTRYRKAFRYTADPDRFIVEVHRAGYATSPTYPATIRGVMAKYKLYRYDVAE